MARIVPNSDISFYKDVEDSRPVAFSSRSNQRSYFDSKLVGSISRNNYSMVRKTSSRIRIEGSPTTIKECNYLSFQNPSFDNKTYYCKIIDYEYINNECVEVLFAIDFFQSYMFDVTYESCMIDREHLSEHNYEQSLENPYSIWEFQTPENLAVGEDLEPFQYDYEGQSDGSCFAFEKAGYSRGTATINLLMAAYPIPPADKGTEPYDDNKPQNQLNDEEQWFRSFRSSHSIANKRTGQYPDYSYSSSFIGGVFSGKSFYNNFTMPLEIYALEDDEDLSLFLNHMTLWNATSSIAALFAVPEKFFEACCERHVLSLRDANQLIPETYTSRKLCCYPYAYIRVETPSGDRKEFRYENFRPEFQQTPGTIQFYISGSICGVPRINIVPNNYKGDYGSHENFNERISYSGFPQIPFCTDSFISFLSSAATDLMRSRTNTMYANTQAAAYQIDKMGAWNALASGGGQLIKGAIAGLKSGGGNVVSAAAGLVTGAVNAGVGIYSGAFKQSSEANLIEHASELRSDSDNLALSNLENNAVYSEYSATRPAFTSSEYHNTSEGGFEIFDPQNKCDFTVTAVRLRNDMLYKYDVYFRNYGYTQGIYGLPKICSFIKGSSSDTALPHWDDPYPGATGNKKITYVKTTGMNVCAPTKPVADYFRALFDGGVQFINGDELR